jgi:hypothetical protein
VNEISYQDNLITKFLIKSSKYGKFEAIIDTKNWENIKQYHWSLFIKNNYKYARTNTKIKATFLHHMILKNVKMIDHKNHNTLDCTITNLRECNHSTNAQNKKMHCNNTSGYKGVHYKKSLKKWGASIMKNNKIFF